MHDIIFSDGQDSQWWVLIFIIPIIPLSTDNSLISPHPQGVYSAGPQGSSVFQNKVTLWEYN
jgi:hypothetical protein